MSRKSSISPSWALDSWPPEIYPGTLSKARYLVRAHRSELLECGALARVGRDLVIIGSRYERWLEKQIARVPDYEIPANRARAAANSTNPTLPHP